MNSAVINGLRALLVLVLVGSVLGQVLVVLIAQANGAEDPWFVGLEVPYSIAGIATIACFQAAVVSIWALLTMVATGRIYSRRALRWVAVIIWCGAIATGIVVATAANTWVVVGSHAPGVALGLVGSLVAGSTFVLLMIVMRGLLATAIADRAELAEVI
ncbi:DUF2975 domain-containing protein [Demequina maris]|uniref:DUF2975 domain-containing protein n=1 Tax=Demequina maris TaxID=1638982 RepID=UPI000780E4DB|nr:DUF2975 domain-containing protein [Demequina maris]